MCTILINHLTKLRLTNSIYAFIEEVNKLKNDKAELFKENISLSNQLAALADEAQIMN